MIMRIRLPYSILLTSALAVAAACTGKPADSHEYTLQGQVLSIAGDHKEATIKHEDIKGFMPAMTMPYKVREGKELENLTPGDLINATLVVESNDAYLKGIKKVGQAPLEKAPETMRTASAGFELLKDGEPVPTTSFIDQDGKKRTFTSFAGKAVVLTFIYTRCPMPTFCPMMDRNFVALQDRIKADPNLGVHLVTVSFDPATDTPAVLKAHGTKLGFNPRIWTFLTGDRDEIDRFASRFGVSVARAMTDQKDITHNLRTALIDRQGNLVKTYTGNEWTPAEVMADIKILVGVD
jgi:protein SCO1/2